MPVPIGNINFIRFSGEKYVFNIFLLMSVINKKQ